MTQDELGELFACHPQPKFGEDDFDDLLWGAVCDVVNDDRLATLPIPILVYYTTRWVEWEVANGGFDQLVWNLWNGRGRTLDSITIFLNWAADGYDILARHVAAAQIRQAIQATQAEFQRLSELHGPEYTKVSIDEMDIDVFLALDDVIAETEWRDFQSDEQRLAYVVANKDVFIAARLP